MENEYDFIPLNRDEILKQGDREYWNKRLFKNDSWTSAAHKFLSGNKSFSISMFNWGEGPGSSDYWSAFYYHKTSDKHFEDAKSFVRWALRVEIEDKGEE